ncbi:hypothetical protein FOL46_005604 [Perkinsus olseni]|uniref:Amidase domain-containing protein n=2 Tax=Perkinsus olseni TaxID=32597 RepID=A0A7J6LS38_PEROL|nr:hypothetical protein FOL46_005604 [Perkinsus olseni]
MAAPSTESTAQLTDAQRQSADNYDLKAMNVMPLTGIPLKLAAYAMTGTNFIKRTIRSLVAKKTFKDIGVPALKTFADTLEGRLKWPFYRLSKQASPSDAVDQDPSKGEDLTGPGPRPYYSIEDYHHAFLQGALDPLDVAGVVYNQAKLLNKSFHFMAEFADWQSIQQAASASSQRYKCGKPLSKLDGLLFIIKEEMSVEHLMELVGTNPRNSKNPRLARPATKNDPVVQALLDAGAILFGTSVMHEYGISPVGYNVWYHGPLNAFDRTRYTGGSSSGSATGVALGLFTFAIGFDGGGSVRDPSAWSGVVGAIATFGAVKFENDETGIFTTLHCGPITTNADDAAIVLSVMANTKNQGKHFYDKVYQGMFGVPMPKINFAPPCQKTFTIGYDTAWVHDSDPEIEAMFYDVRDWIHQQPGWSIKDNFVMTHWNEQAISHTLTIGSEFHQTHKNDVIDILEPNTKISLDLGSEVDEGIIEAAEKVKKWASERWLEQFEKMDAVMTPSMAIPPQIIQKGVNKYGLFNVTLVSIMTRYIWPANLAGFPSVTVTIKNNKDDLPIGIQMICRPFEDGKCLSIARKIEEHFEGQREHPEQWIDVIQESSGVHHAR